VPSVTAVLLVALGLFAILGRPPTVSAAVARSQEKAAHGPVAPSIEPHELPCCAGDEPASPPPATPPPR
jgi:hypothetical protein